MKHGNAETRKRGNRSDRRQASPYPLLVLGVVLMVGALVAAAVLADVVSSPQVPDVVNYAGLCRWACDDGEIRTAVGWEDGALEVVLARPVDLDPATGLPLRDAETGAWAGAMELRRAPRDAASADIHDCVTYSGPGEPFLRVNPTCECCLGFDLDGDRDVDLLDLVGWQRRTVPR